MFSFHFSFLSLFESISTPFLALLCQLLLPVPFHASSSLFIILHALSSFCCFFVLFLFFSSICSSCILLFCFFLFLETSSFLQLIPFLFLVSSRFEVLLSFPLLIVFLSVVVPMPFLFIFLLLSLSVFYLASIASCFASASPASFLASFLLLFICFRLVLSFLLSGRKNLN